MKTIPHLAIIPAKAESSRCPGKNTRLFGSYPLFMHSVHYAIQEGFTPVVSTDSEDIIALCLRKNILYIREIVYERKMEFCVRQVLNAYSCLFFAVLQPTSPFRKEGLLKTMLHDAENLGLSSCYTSQKIKLIGHLDGRFHQAHRTQDSKRFLYFHDGNIALSSQPGFFARDAFFDDDSRLYDNPFPCNLQIDTEEEFSVMEHLCSFPRFRKLLPSPANAMRLCIISNKRDIRRNYSEFVDSCDIVMRINKMDNLKSGLTGSKTDMALVSCCRDYMDSPREQRNVSTLHTVPRLYFNDEEPQRTPAFAHQENLEHWKLIPPDVSRCTLNFTTLSKGFLLADYLFPKACIYYLGDCSMEQRCPRSWKHHSAPEDAFLQSMIASGRITPIIEDEAAEYRYSQAAEASPPENEKTKPDTISAETPRTMQNIVNLWHPDWSDTFRIVGNRGARIQYQDAALVLRNDENALHLLWDRWGKETFVRGADNWYYWVSPSSKQCLAPKHEGPRRIGFMRVLNEENTIAACMLSVAPALDDLLILWADMDDQSIEQARRWQPVLERDYACRCHFLHYPHHVVPPHSVSDLRTLPEENRVSTYYNFGMEYLQNLFGNEKYSVSKVDADQIYLPEHFGKAFTHIRTPMDCIALTGHNTIVHQGKFVVYKPSSRNGGGDSLICGSGNLPQYATATFYETDTSRHPNKTVMNHPCWLHFMRTAKYDRFIRAFHDDEVMDVGNYPEIANTYRTRVLPLLLRTGSPYKNLILE